MNERFTDRSRRVFNLANQEAQKLNHEYIGTEHILLGLVREGSGVGATALKNLDFDYKKAEINIRKLVREGPDMATMGRFPQTPKAKAVIEEAINYARSIKHHYIGTEHLLYGLLQDEKEIAYQVLKDSGLDKDKIIGELENLIGIISQEKNAEDSLLTITKELKKYRDGISSVINRLEKRTEC